ncbi:hypothetical protein [Halonatronum saccharophilum]|uniref:hypothetical protein n=1 Tax=Halonatronum saccharophilum TaxID=150060 RepID=UPI0004BA28BC|nr:hypothetical protein [Halonatronum saccharophilum]
MGQIITISIQIFNFLVWGGLIVVGFKFIKKTFEALDAIVEIKYILEEIKEKLD